MKPSKQPKQSVDQAGDANRPRHCDTKKRKKRVSSHTSHPKPSASLDSVGTKDVSGLDSAKSHRNRTSSEVHTGTCSHDHPTVRHQSSPYGQSSSKGGAQLKQEQELSKAERKRLRREKRARKEERRRERAAVERQREESERKEQERKEKKKEKKRKRKRDSETKDEDRSPTLLHDDGRPETGKKRKKHKSQGQERQRCNMRSRNRCD